MFKKLRVALLAFLLLNVALGAWVTRTRTTSWERTLYVTVHAINGDGSAASSAYIEHLLGLDRAGAKAFFGDIEAFFAREAGRHGVSQPEPIEIVFAGARSSHPPPPPRAGSVLAIMAWSLELRLWAWRHDDYDALQDAEIHVLYFDPQQSPTLAHSLGLQKGLIGVVNAFASTRMTAENHVVIAHELLHMVGAGDKYDPATNLPRVPDGLADPYRDPLYPQDQAEIMAGRIATASDGAVAPKSLADVVIGDATAREIHWRD